MGTSYYRAGILPVTGTRLVAWQVDLQRRSRPARTTQAGPRVLRLQRLTGSEIGGTSNESGLLELTVFLNAAEGQQAKR